MKKIVETYFRERAIMKIRQGGNQENLEEGEQKNHLK